MILLEELSHINNQVTYNRQAGQRTQHNGLRQAADIDETRQTVFPIDVHAV